MIWLVNFRIHRIILEINLSNRFSLDNNIVTPCSHPVTACNTLESTYTCLNFSYKIDLQPLKLSAIHIFIIHTHTSMLGRKNEHTKVSYSLIHAKYTLRMHKDNKKWMVLLWFVGSCCHFKSLKNRFCKNGVVLKMNIDLV